MADQYDWILFRPIGNKTLLRIVAGPSGMACRQAVRLAVIDPGSFDLREQLARTVMKRADRAAFCFIRREGCGKLCKGIAPIGEPSELSGTPSEQSMNENDVI